MLRAVGTALVQFSTAFPVAFGALVVPLCAPLPVSEQRGFALRKSPVKKSAFQMESSNDEFPQEQFIINCSNTKI